MRLFQLQSCLDMAAKSEQPDIWRHILLLGKAIFELWDTSVVLPGPDPGAPEKPYRTLILSILPLLYSNEHNADIIRYL